MRKRQLEAPAPSLRVHGWASGSASLRSADDVVDRIGAGLRTPRRYDEEDTRHRADPPRREDGLPQPEH
jgi:hypothetical protein